MTNVFVYGTLLSGLGNHRCLTGATFVAATETADAVYTMMAVSSFPGVVIGGRDKIVGEVYQVDDAVFDRLDHLESFPSMYTRVQVPLANGLNAWMYIWNDFDGSPVVPKGDWRAYDTSAWTYDHNQTVAEPMTYCDGCDEPIEDDDYATDGSFAAHRRCLNQLFG